MTDLDADCRALLDLGREGLGPDPATVARLRSRVEAAVVVAGGATVTAGVASKLGLSTAKLILIATATVAVTTAAVVMHERGTSAPTVSFNANGDSSADSGAGISPQKRETAKSAVAVPVVESTTPVVAVSSPAAAVSSSAAPPVRRSHDVAAPAHKSSPPHASLTRETELVDLATSAMRSGDLATLRETVQVYARETGNAGQLAEDIAAIEVEALCRANDSDASNRLAAFLARWPTAGERLTAACKGIP